MPTWKLWMEYEGTRYRGWQEQQNARTVAGELRRAAEEWLEERVEIAGAGRTDAGVHALFQIVSLRTSRALNAAALRQGLNDRLPADINIRQVERAPAAFHPRHDAVERFYLYQIATRRTAFGKPFVWWVRDRLTVDAMQRAAARLPGRHDFSAFQEIEKKAPGGGAASANWRAGSRANSPGPLVQVTSCELAVSGDLILFRIGASHFLWKMVRRLVGVLVEVGRGNIAPEHILRLSHAEIAALTAPPAGLFLEYIRYAGAPPPAPLRPAFCAIFPC